ncbi:unnamed protein product, partial [Rotaria sp. Silwood2]
CTFYTNHSSLRLQNIIQQLKSYNKLRSFRLILTHYIAFYKTEKQYLSKTILTHQSSALRSLELEYYCNHSHLATVVTLNWTLTSLTLTFYDLPQKSSIYCVLHVLRIYRVLQRLCIRISIPTRPDIQYAYTPILPTAYYNNLPVLPCLEYFDLQTKTMCDIHSLSLILRCMPNLHQFIFTFMSSHEISLYIDDMLDGHQWQQMLTSYVPHLETFDFLIGLFYTRPILNMDYIVHSFQYFVAHYNGWHMAIEHSRLITDESEDYISLRTLTYSMNRRENDPVESNILLGTFDVRSTLTIDAQYHYFHNHNRKLEVIIPLNMSLTGNLPSSPPFQNVQHLIVIFQMSISTLWKNIWEPVSIHNDVNDEFDTKECVNTLMRLVDLSTIKKLDFEPMNNLSQLHCIEQILLVCSNMIQLRIGTQLFLSPILFDNPSFTFILSRLQGLQLLTDDVDELELLIENIYFPLKHASKLIQSCPSLIDIELQVYSFDTCVHLVDILLDGFVNLLHLKIYFTNDTILDNPYSRNYVIEKRRQAFPRNIFNANRVVVKINRQSLEIYL